MENTVAEPIKETGIELLNQRESELREILTNLQGLKINGLDDKEGYNKVDAARKELKNARVNVQNDAKELRERAIKFQRLVIDREKELIAIIKPLEKSYEEDIEKIDKQREAIKKEEERKRAGKINNRIKQLREFNFEVDIQMISSKSDEDFEVMLSDVRKEWELEQERQEKIKAEAEKKRIEEEDRLKKEREEMEKIRQENDRKQKEIEAAQEKIRKEQEERQKELEAEQEKIRNEQAEKQKAIDAEREKLEAERKAFEEQRRKEEEEKKRQAEIKAAEERAKLETEERLKREQKEKEELEEREKQEALRKESLRPDREKLVAITNTLNSMTFPEVSSVEAGEVIAFAKSEIKNLSASIYQRAMEL